VAKIIEDWRRPGVRMNQRTVDMILAVENNLGFRLAVVQGSYNNGKVQASAGTHDGGGAADIRAKTLPPGQRQHVVTALRRVGFAAWLRTPQQGFDEVHIHAIAVGDEDLSAGALAQVRDYRNGRNGLKGHGPDDGHPGFRAMTWERFRQLHMIADATSASSLEAKKKDNHISVQAVRMAARGEPISHKFAFDAEQFMAFAFSGVKVIPATTFMAWRKTRDKRFFVFAVKCVQARFKLRQDGDPGPVTMAKLEQFGYIVTP
jgi:hypothetical protein